MPSQNCGITKPTVDSWPVTVEKTRLPRRTERTARSAASGSEMSSVISASSSEGMIRSTTAGPTGPPPSWTPKSPCAAFSSQITNWIGTGLSSPRRSRSASTSTWRSWKVRSSRLPTRISAASPGRALAIA